MHTGNDYLIGILGVVVATCALAACTATPVPVQDDFAFDGTCVNCHAGLSAGHVHGSYKLRCIDCHGGNDQAPIPEKLFDDKTTPLPRYRDPELLKLAHVLPKSPKLARFFFANGVDDNGDGRVDETVVLDKAMNPTQILDGGEVFEPQLHGEGAGEFIDTELSRDLNYTRFLNPGDLRVATVGCGAKNRAGIDGGFGCHQQTIDVVRRNIMVNQSAVINGAYYGNESWRSDFFLGHRANADPRGGVFAYSLDYDGADACIDPPAVDPGGRAQPRFNSTCLEARATMLDKSVAADAPGNAGLPAFEIAQNAIEPVAGSQVGATLIQLGANDTRLPWGGFPDDATAERDRLGPVLNGDLIPGVVPDPVDVTLRTFRAYYPLNYPGSTTNFNFTFGTSILPEIARFNTSNPYGRGHSSGCSACHAPYSYEGSRSPTQVLQDNGTVVAVVDPTTQHREFHSDQDQAEVGGENHLIGRAVTAQQQAKNNRAQQKTYSANHNMTTKIDTDTCGLCHGFVTRINLAYQGMAEEEQRDQLARRKQIEFDTPGLKTHVIIHDSWVREDNTQLVDTPDLRSGLATIVAARQRDAMLAAQGFIAGNGGCAQATFTEDCNNNGELDRALVLTRTDENGNQFSITIDEDLNNNAALDLIDRVPREKSIDGRQMRYVYGGRNGSTRQMDIHFERGMHCIDCHFLQDVHGDGHVYSTNWDTIEIECEDCHGAKNKTKLVTSGPNGGNDLRRGRNDDLRPFFEDRGDVVIQRSRVTPGLSWQIPQTFQVTSPLAQQAHDDRHMGEPGQGSTFTGMQGQSPLVDAKVECQTCHSSWVHNCMGCHLDLNLGDPQRKVVDATGAIKQSAQENEVWMSNASSPAHVNFQLLGFLRSPLILGTGSVAEKGRLAPFRSSMQVHATVTDATGDILRDNLTFTTFQTVDGNSQRTNVATSAVAMNQTMPHTTRPGEARGCETCHVLLDPAGRVRNEHLLAETFGLGTGAYPYVGDWAIAAGNNGIELFEYKQERELVANLMVPNAAMTSQRFPGMIVNPNNPTAANVEPIFGAGVVGVDVALVRNFNPTPAVGSTLPPTLRDLAIVAVNDNGTGKLVVSDITVRGHRTLAARQAVGTGTGSFVLTPLPQPPTALAHLSPDVSDPFVYVSVGTAGVSVVRLLDAPGVGVQAARLVRTVALPGGRAATDVALAGDLLYVGTSQGTVDVFNLDDPETPVFVSSTPVDAGHAINDLAVSGFVLYIATQSGVAAISLDDPSHPMRLAGTSVITFTGPPASGISVSSGHVYVAARAAGVIDLDMRTPAAPVVVGNLAPMAVDAVDVVVSKLPGQTWLLAIEGNGNLIGIKLDNTKSIRERCFPDPRSAGCLLDMDFLDPTIMQRDPSFDPVTQTFDDPVKDPSSVTFFRQNSRILLTQGRKLARPAIWEALNTLTGRRLRDSFMPGSGTLSLGVMQTMRSVELCESNVPSNNASGLNQLGYAGAGACQPIGDQRRPASVCRMLPTGVARCQPRGAAAGPAGSRPVAPIASQPSAPLTLPTPGPPVSRAGKQLPSAIDAASGSAAPGSRRAAGAWASPAVLRAP